MTRTITPTNREDNIVIRMIELNDLDREVVPVSKVGSTIRSWYSSPSLMTADDVMIDELHEALNEQDYETARDIAAELGIGFDEVQTVTGF